MNSFLSPELLKVANEINQWCIDFLAAENPDVRRPKGNQTVCPFIKPSMDNDTFYLTFHPEVDGRDEDEIEKISLSYIDTFRKTYPVGESQKLTKALLIVFNNIKEKDGEILDIVHNRIKDIFVKNGLMVGQFHPKCKETGAYNTQLKVSRSPYPLIAVRNMSIHDILFLKNSKEWFMAYNLWFGDKFKKNELEEHNTHLEIHYIEAKKKFNL